MDTLVLAHDYSPISQIDWKRAIALLSLGVVEVIEEYDDWTVRSVTIEFKVPAVIRWLKAVRWRKRSARFSRENVYTRDRGLCQYCGHTVTRADATYDHVIPSSRGGTTSWENIVIACLECNQQKRNRTPQEAGMRLRVKPTKPDSLPGGLRITLPTSDMPEKWRSALRALGYWHGELK